MTSDRTTCGVPAELFSAARTAAENIEAAVAACRDFGHELPLPGSGATADRWTVLSRLARTNLTFARVFEAHTDAVAILAEAGIGERAAARSWGVFAAEAPSARLEAAPDGAGFRLTGRKPWCSVADALDAALVTAFRGQHRQLFAVDLRAPGVHVDPPEKWVARGLRTVTSVAVDFDAVPAEPVGEPEWYLHRPGFAWGGIGVAACWHGGAQGLADTLGAGARNRRRELDALHVGIVDVALHASASALAGAAAAIDAGTVDAPEVLALRTRAVVASSVELVLSQVGHALGPAPLSFDEQHAARVADLTLYVRQHHAERDLAQLGDALIAAQQ